MANVVLAVSIAAGIMWSGCSIFFVFFVRPEDDISRFARLGLAARYASGVFLVLWTISMFLGPLAPVWPAWYVAILGILVVQIVCLLHSMRGMRDWSLPKILELVKRVDFWQRLSDEDLLLECQLAPDDADLKAEVARRGLASRLRGLLGKTREVPRRSR